MIKASGWVGQEHGGIQGKVFGIIVDRQPRFIERVKAFQIREHFAVAIVIGLLSADGVTPYIRRETASEKRERSELIPKACRQLDVITTLASGTIANARSKF